MSIKILIVEDNIDLTDAYELVFKKEGFNIQVVYDGMQAEEALEIFSPDVILLDIMMPQMNGFEFLKNLRASGSKTTVIINSNLSQNSEVKKSFELGANEYLRKSDYTVFELVDKVKEIVEN
ncbi:response regulator [Candidatus Peregrinibacteria bacterium]|jgi:DNA-binding response OmpR family regulator|nr:response regulator [Candidatus Peregrinibacteria bacterium]